MADKQNTVIENTEALQNDLVPIEERAKKGVKAQPETPAEAPKASAKSKKVKAKKPLGKKLKEVFSELKKVSWPTFGKVVKQTGVVIAVVLCFLVIIGLTDVGLSALMNLIIG